jgi:transposase
MIDVSSDIFVHTTFVDMRKSIDGLSILASLAGGIFEHGKAFVFLNKGRDKVKILVKENNGFVLLYKRLDQGQFKIVFTPNKALTISRQQLRWLLEGLDYGAIKCSKERVYTHHF